MRAAIYCRKSTEQNGTATAEKSVANQERECRALIDKNGWTVELEHVYVDDGISGAVFGEGRPALLKLIAAVKTHPRPFDAVVAYDESRLGRDVIEVGYLVKSILDHDVRLFFANGTERRLDSATDALLMSITSFGGAFEREQASKRTRDVLRTKAAAGHQTGTVPFGYAAVVKGSHKELAVDPLLAPIVRQIFTLASQGNGITRIAHALNREHSGRRKWNAPTVRNILRNETYSGRVVYGKHRVVVKGGKKRRVAVPEAEWVTIDRPELAIIEAPLWNAVKARQATMFASYLRGAKGRLQGRPEHTVSEHLLTGFVVCGTCGGRLVVWSAKSAKARRAAPDKPAYRSLCCWRNKSGGPALCSNYRAVPLQPLTDAIVEHFRSDVLTPERIAQVARDLAADAESAPERVAQRRGELDADLRRLDQRLAKLTEAVAEGGPVKTLVEAIRQAEGEQRETQAKIEQLAATQALVQEWSSAGQKGKVETLLANWQDALAGSPIVARQILRKLLVSPITVTPESDGSFSYEALGSYARVIVGTIGGEAPRSLTIKRGGMERPDDLAAELKALAGAQQPAQGYSEADRPGRRGGPTS